jgi:hypothetical protein
MDNSINHLFKKIVSGLSLLLSTFINGQINKRLEISQNNENFVEYEPEL